MSSVLALDQTKSNDIATVGEKAARLSALIQLGLPVPRGFVVTGEAYGATMAGNGLDAQMAARLTFEMDDPVELENAAEEIRLWIEAARLPPALVHEVEIGLGSLSPLESTELLYAVRASRISQDVPNPRSSGLEQAYLGVRGATGVLDAIRKCWATLWTSRAIYYRHKKRVSAPPTLAVVVQPMVAAEAAGVMFTVNPLSGAADEIHIDGTWGLGEAIMAARWAPDHFVVGKKELAIRERRIASKTVMETAAPDGGWQMVTVPAARQEMACLSDGQLVALAHLGVQVEDHFVKPQDVEWCRVGDELMLLQTRPLIR